MSPLSAPMSASTLRSDPPSSGGTLVALDGRALPLRATDLSGRVRGGYGRIVLRQRFFNPHAEPLRVTYQVPLPSDAAVAGFRFRIGEEDVTGEIERKDRARERFERAIVEGRTAALLEQDRSALFTQDVGNIPPGTEVLVTLEIDQKLRFIPDADAHLGGWEWRFPTVVAPRYLGEPGRVADGSRIAVDVADRPRPITMALALQIAEPLAENGNVRSPSHGLALAHAGGVTSVAFADQGVGLDRDVVVRWPVTAREVGVGLDIGRPAADRATWSDAFALLTLVPPSVTPRTIARDLIVLLDTSGSMHGEPIAHSKHVTSALVQTLGERDTLELIEFSSSARRWSRGAVAMTEKNKREALEWIASLSAGGGTEMRTGILEALAGLRSEAQRQVVLVTDGLIGFEQEVVGEIAKRLPAGSRVHTVGVGSAVNRSLTTPAARAGRGVEVIVGIGEDPERAAARLHAHTHAPIVVDVHLSGDALAEHAPARLPDLFAHAPALVAARLRPQGGELVVRGRTEDGPWTARVHVPATQPGDGSSSLAALFARELVEDLELRHATGETSVDEAIATIGLRFGISTRLTSWIAVSASKTVDPRDPTRRESIPQELPHGMSVEGLGLRTSAAAPMQQVMTRSAYAPGPLGMPAPAPASAAGGAPMEKKAKTSVLSNMLGGFARGRAKKREADEGTRMAPPSVSAPPPPPRESEAQPEMLDDDDESTAADRISTVDAFREEQAKIAPLPRRPSAPPRAVPGRIVTHRDGKLVIEVQITPELAFDRDPTAPHGVARDWPDEIELQLGDGRWIRVRIDKDASTRAWPLAAGTIVRLVLDVPDDATDPRALRSIGGSVLITL